MGIKRIGSMIYQKCDKCGKEESYYNPTELNTIGGEEDEEVALGLKPKKVYCPNCKES